MGLQDKRPFALVRQDCWSGLMTERQCESVLAAENYYYHRHFKSARLQSSWRSLYLLSSEERSLRKDVAALFTLPEVRPPIRPELEEWGAETAVYQMATALQMIGAKVVGALDDRPMPAAHLSQCKCVQVFPTSFNVAKESKNLQLLEMYGQALKQVPSPETTNQDVSLSKSRLFGSTAKLQALRIRQQIGAISEALRVFEEHVLSLSPLLAVVAKRQPEQTSRTPDGSLLSGHRVSDAHYSLSPRTRWDSGPTVADTEQLPIWQGHLEGHHYAESSSATEHRRDSG